MNKSTRRQCYYFVAVFIVVALLFSIALNAIAQQITETQTNTPVYTGTPTTNQHIIQDAERDFEAEITKWILSGGGGLFVLLLALWKFHSVRVKAAQDKAQAEAEQKATISAMGNRITAVENNISKIFSRLDAISSSGKDSNKLLHELLTEVRNKK